MTVNTVTREPENEGAWKALRTFDITSTESAALFGESPYATEFVLWHQKSSGEIPDFNTNERMDWGTDLQDAIAISIGRRYGVKVGRITEYMRLPDAKMGSSFDFEIVGVDGQDEVSDAALRDMFAKHGAGILEIKNVDSLVFRDQWIKRVDDDEFIGGRKEITPPGHIEVQVQHQLHVRGNAWAAIGVLVGGNTGRLVIRMRDEAVGQALEARVRQFWKSVDDGIEPPPRYPGDADFVKSLYKMSADEHVYDGRANTELDEIIAEYKDAGNREKLASEDKKVAQAKALRIIGDAARAYTERYTISAGTVAGSTYTVERKPYRGWRVTVKK